MTRRFLSLILSEVKAEVEVEVEVEVAVYSGRGRRRARMRGHHGGETMRGHASSSPGVHKG